MRIVREELVHHSWSKAHWQWGMKLNEGLIYTKERRTIRGSVSYAEPIYRHGSYYQFTPREILKDWWILSLSRSLLVLMRRRLAKSSRIGGIALDSFILRVAISPNAAITKAAARYVQIDNRVFSQRLFFVLISSKYSFAVISV